MRLLFKILAVPALLILIALGAIVLAPDGTLRLLVDLQRRQAGLERKSLRIADGLTVVYLEGGRGEPLVLLHGLGGNKDNFLRIAGALTDRYRVIIPDQVGFGESSRPAAADYAPPAQAERLRRFLQALGLSRVHLGGNSMGGQIALTYAARYRDDVASLWLLAPSGLWSAPAGMARQHAERTGEIPLLVRREQDMARVMRWVTAKPPPLPPPLLKAMARERIANAGLEERVMSLLLEHSLEGQIRGLATPALVVWGSQDRILSAETASVLGDLLPHSRAVIMAGVGHVPMLEAPQPTVRAYLGWRDALPRPIPGQGTAAPAQGRLREAEKAKPAS